MWIYDEKNPWTKRREEFEADNRDYAAENILWVPTAQELKDLPESIDLLKDLPRTYDQGSLGACTAYALTHIQLYQNCKEFESSLVELDPLWLWKNMWHDPANRNDSWDYLENALNASVKKWIPGTDPSGKKMDYMTQSYSFKAFWALMDSDINYIKWQLSLGHPLYTAIKGTSKTWKELSAWELVTVYSASEATGWHAVAIFWIDKEYIYFANSWFVKAWDKVATFKIKISTMKEMIRGWWMSWRYRVVYDKKDITVPMLFEDYYKDPSTEEYKAVKYCKDNWIIKWSNGKLLPNAPVTREQMCMILYRLSKFAEGWVEYSVTKPTKLKSAPAKPK